VGVIYVEKELKDKMGYYSVEWDAPKLIIPKRPFKRLFAMT
jgi:hypothetical protein